MPFKSLPIEPRCTSSAPLDLPVPIATYFEAEREKNLDLLSRCFTSEALVTDEGHTYRGVSEIQNWKVKSSSAYNYTSQPFAIEEKEGQFLVTSRVEGNFPGSPIDLRYCFDLSGDKIAALEIMP